MNRLTKIIPATRYTYSEVTCTECNGEDDRCEVCDGLGVVNPECPECNIITALNAEGLCAKCADANDLTLAEFVAKYHPHLEVRL